ncbi:MAG TPA: glycosyltransferase family 2 protein [Candidatus Saccharimonadales bacterium]|nr:glycosyltransferase family 2 protein [Candidatus Saccharimonadales bacterium]
MKLSIIIPVFNEEKTIEKVLDRLGKVAFGDTSVEVIIVNDGSTDDTELRIKNYELRIRKKDTFKKISYLQNKGKGFAVKTGLEKATGDYVIIQDADLEYDPNFIPELIEQLVKNKADVVYGTRLKRLPHLSKEEKTPQFFIHYIGNRFLSFLTSLLYGQWITDMETGYKLFPADAAKEMRLCAKRFDFEPEITAKLLKKGLRILEIPISTTPRGYDEGKKLHTVRDGIKALWTLLKCRFTD